MLLRHFDFAWFLPVKHWATFVLSFQAFFEMVGNHVYKRSRGLLHICKPQGSGTEEEKLNFEAQCRGSLSSAATSYIVAT